jgi:hypothetical protein
MSKYIKGMRVWHLTDPSQQGKTFVAHHRHAILAVCGGLIPAGFAQADAPIDSDPVCPVCLKAPSDAKKRSFNKTYAKLIPAPKTKTA